MLESVFDWIFFEKWYFLSYIINDFTLKLLICVSIYLTYIYLRGTGLRKENLPPLLRGLPVIGLLPWMIYYKPYVYIWMLGKKYGSMLTFRIAGNYLVFINDYELSKQFSIHPDFQGRPKRGILYEFSGGLGIASSEGALWKHQRRFTMHSLKDSGMGKLNMQDKIGSEISRAIHEIEKFRCGVVPIDVILEKSMCNIICSLAFNKQYEYDDPNLNIRIDTLNQNFRLIEQLNSLSLMWWTRPFLQGKLKTLSKNDSDFKAAAKKLIEDHRSTFDENNPRDLIDLFLIEMSREPSNSEEKEYKDTFFENQLMRLIQDLFAAGTETGSTTIRWALLYMLHYPEIQTKIQQEIDEVIGSERMPTISDRSQLPLTTATLQEVERLASVAPASLPRSNPNATKFNGYDFPPRTTVHFNLYAIHRDPNLWKNPEDFDPNRFLDDSGHVFRPPHLMPFGSGKRICPGESLAKVEIFLFFAALLQKFRFEPSGDKLPSLAYGTGFARAPYPFKLKALDRSL